MDGGIAVIDPVGVAAGVVELRPAIKQVASVVYTQVFTWLPTAPVTMISSWPSSSRS
jgi:hypothetical protein